MGWFKRLKDGITTATRNKLEAPDGLWYKCDDCKETSTRKEFIENTYICLKCGYHSRIGSAEYFDLLFDGKYELKFENIIAKDILEFEDLKKYKDRLTAARKKNDVSDAISVGVGKIGKKTITIACMDFSFIGGSMGSVVGERISKAIDHCLAEKTPLIIISKSGGARMMEASFSLMQMAKTSAKLSMLSKAKIPFISLLTNPTTGGVTASFAMLGDINIAEPEALIAFAGPRVVKDFIKKDLPEGFQTSEFLLEHGFLDFIIERKLLKRKISDVLSFLN